MCQDTIETIKMFLHPDHITVLERFMLCLHYLLVLSIYICNPCKYTSKDDNNKIFDITFPKLCTTTNADFIKSKPTRSGFTASSSPKRLLTVDAVQFQLK